MFELRAFDFWCSNHVLQNKGLIIRYRKFKWKFANLKWVVFLILTYLLYIFCLFWNWVLRKWRILRWSGPLWRVGRNPIIRYSLIPTFVTIIDTFYSLRKKKIYFVMHTILIVGIRCKKNCASIMWKRRSGFNFKLGSICSIPGKLVHSILM